MSFSVEFPRGETVEAVSVYTRTNGDIVLAMSVSVLIDDLHAVLTAARARELAEALIAAAEDRS